MKPNVDWFRRKLEEHRLSQSGLGRMLDIDRSTMSMLLSGKRKLKLEKAADMARILGVTVSDVIENMGIRVDGIKAGDVSAPHLLPFDGWIDDSARVHQEPGGRRKRIDIGVSVEPGATALQFRTPQSNMDVLDGWIVVSGAKREPDDRMVGRGCVVGTKDGEILLRTIRRGYAPGSYNLLRLGSAEPKEAEIEWYAPILLMKPASS
ncbi:MAG: helix-turn-helix transcriptional regulator [Mesorhizobium sp.]|uniref:helix-turn-helix transcriptional regulator n=1 Tax=Mesorhizobium sp. TaxID=1871066 RepID=UPI000FE78CF5|nr:helix-turn-helix transcriptional regulator [Mesorhizobium sp.]RWE59791.1 MAG: XRE family transcriptional regulator [Mesorhizobium sp.]TIY04240.1 MAG: helix-turn-helix transcriptional regulator [Mesorhizobium sp.]